MPDVVLDATDQRILGSLLEKQRTVPGSYPLTLNSLRLACNQTSGRDPVTDYDDATLTAALRSLKERGLVRVVWAGKGSRTLKYHQLLDSEFTLEDPERAVLTLLLLRGPQSAGELKIRTERLHHFSDKDEVTACLSRMAAADPSLVRELPVTSGRQNTRWTQLLGPSPVHPGTSTHDRPDRERVLSAGARLRDEQVIAAYDLAAANLAAASAEELCHRPLDVWLLERVAESVTGPILDLGCGPGHVTAFLADTGAEVHGLDASASMIDRARAAFPDLEFNVGRFHQVLRPRNSAAWGVIVARFALIHLAESELTPTLRTVGATLAAEGKLLLSLYLGQGVQQVGELAGAPVELNYVGHDRDQTLAAVKAAGLTVTEWYLRGPVGEEPAPSLHLIASPTNRLS